MADPNVPPEQITTKPITFQPVTNKLFTGGLDAQDTPLSPDQVNQDTTNQQTDSTTANCPGPTLPLSALAGLAKGIGQGKGRGKGGKLKGGVKDPNWRGGVVFKNTAGSFQDQPALKDALKAGTITNDDARTLIGVSQNEGGTNTLQGQDSETASVGWLQVTINKNGQGELPALIEQFAKKDPEAYKRLFADKGLTIQHDSIKTKGGKTVLDAHATIYYKDPNQPNMKPITGRALRAYTKDKNNHLAAENALRPLHDAAGDPAFIKLMLEYFQNRLKTAIGTNVNGHPLSSYVHNLEARADALDQSVNRPAYVKPDFTKAVKQFYKDNPLAPKNPDSWTPEQRAIYEPQILKDYLAVRRTYDATNRAKRLHNYFNPPKPKAKGS